MGTMERNGRKERERQDEGKGGGPTLFLKQAADPGDTDVQTRKHVGKRKEGTMKSACVMLPRGASCSQED